MYKAVLFDFFGVIVGRGFENTYRLAGGDPFKDRDSILDLLNQANLGLINDKEFNASIAKELNISVDVWFDSIKKSDATDYDLLSYIAELRKQYKTAILSNSNTGVMLR
jgi:FMN phosphatase YigB (HAD superfamily)